MKEKNINKWEAITEQEKKYFEKHCSSINDPILLILRVHLYAEYLLERIISSYLPRGDRVIDSANLTFFQKLNIVDSFDVISNSAISSLKNLNKVRNRFVHELERELTFADISQIGRPFGKEFNKLRQKYGDDLNICLISILNYLCGFLTAQMASIELGSVESQ